MTLRHLTIFIFVCNENSMTKAADKMHMAQPSISQAISELEKHYNVRLFERLGKQLHLTVAGKKLLTYARHIVNLNDQIEEVMRRFGDTYHIRLGASVTIGECVLIDLLKKLYESYPESHITSAIHNTAVLEDMLLADDLDIAMVEGRIRSDLLVTIPFMDDELIFIAKNNHPLTKKRKINFFDLENVDFFTREKGSGTRDLFEEVMNHHNINYHIIGTYNNAETIKKAVETGIGISVISKLAVRTELESGELCQLKVEGLIFERKFHIVYHKNKYISEGLKTVISFCKNMVKLKA
ncbi:LysR family transcriptional regulator [Pectinatus cerevisiiphilus]|uniref:DNA-binding transcriptional LysR family regulator n=1 Tax=Pectinatus cerevisiiphilus TaxID=86956 RepID=A0A4R3K1T4_9FIRM|nr:LysR family transcriptional regulator [Pectinatus cerevisiiphilus]TCS75810.1 DNA-binding transcriptional LysR family regulator [Pectinatus cerevisiiphilus]